MVKKNGGLQVINASFNKTGTKTIHTALEILGHTVEDAQEAIYSHHDVWAKLWAGEPAGKLYRSIFAPNNKWGYTACCDTPCHVLWESLLDEFPEAKVLLVVRDEEKWINSFEKFFEAEQTQFLEMGWYRLYRPLYKFLFPHSSAPMEVYMDFLRPLCIGPEVSGFYGFNKTLCLKMYRQHNSYVLNHCPKDRLLVYKLDDGWEPLCKFLGEPVPKGDFPWSNRMGSVITELSNHPDYRKVMKRQFLNFGIRLAMIIGAIYLYTHPTAMPDCVATMLDETWKKVGAILAAAVLFYNA